MTRRAIIVLLALVIVALGFAKLANDELRRSTRATTHQLDGRRVMASADAPRAAGASGGSSGGSDVVPVYAEFVAPRPSPPRTASAMTPASRPMGADALGTSLPKRRRWAALGGHGRNGAG